jgi:hypothetical protein
MKQTVLKKHLSDKIKGQHVLLGIQLGYKNEPLTLKLMG